MSQLLPSVSPCVTSTTSLWVKTWPDRCLFSDRMPICLPWPAQCWVTHLGVEWEGQLHLKKNVPFRTCRLNIALYFTFNFTISTDVIREMRIKLCVDISSFTVGTGKLKEPSFFFFFPSGGHLLFTCTVLLSSFPATAVSGSTCFLKLWITSVTQSQFGEEKKKSWALCL